jgi:hypothetical protein
MIAGFLELAHLALDQTKFEIKANQARKKPSPALLQQLFRIQRTKIVVSLYALKERNESAGMHEVKALVEKELEGKEHHIVTSGILALVSPAVWWQCVLEMLAKSAGHFSLTESLVWHGLCLFKV